MDPALKQYAVRLASATRQGSGVPSAKWIRWGAGPRASHHSTRALILAPTRELATQIDDEIQGFSYHAPIASVPDAGISQ